MQIKFDFSEEIDAGAEWLFKTAGPRWFDNINFDRLNLELPYSCILGQLAMTTFKDKFVDLSYFSVIDRYNLDDNNAIRLGFNLDYDFDEDGEYAGLSKAAWEQLTWQWMDKIMQLRTMDNDLEKLEAKV